MNELITATLKSKNDVKLLFLFPEILMNEFEINIVNWIRLYLTRYNRPPSLDRLTQKFTNFVTIESDDPIDDVFDRTLLSKRSNITLEYISKINNFLEDG